MTNPYLVGNFAPVHDEIDAEDLPVVGQVPFELDGVYLRIGPNPRTVENGGNHHWFVGDGMLHGVGLQDGRARRVPQPMGPGRRGRRSRIALERGQQHRRRVLGRPAVQPHRDLHASRDHA